jgi:sulfoxide reductase heme-binding subunit YedZ
MWPLAVPHGFGVAGGGGRQSWMIVIDLICVLAVLTAIGYWVRPDRHPDTVARQAARVAHPMRRPPGSDPRSDR